MQFQNMFSYSVVSKHVSSILQCLHHSCLRNLIASSTQNTLVTFVHLSAPNLLSEIVKAQGYNVSLTHATCSKQFDWSGIGPITFLQTKLAHATLSKCEVVHIRASKSSRTKMKGKVNTNVKRKLEVHV